MGIKLTAAEDIKEGDLVVTDGNFVKKYKPNYEVLKKNIDIIYKQETGGYRVNYCVVIKMNGINYAIVLVAHTDAFQKIFSSKVEPMDIEIHRGAMPKHGFYDACEENCFMVFGKCYFSSYCIGNDKLSGAKDFLNILQTHGIGNLWECMEKDLLYKITEE